MTTTSRVLLLTLLAAAADPSHSAFDPIAGWTPVSDVVEHNKLDLDTLAMETNADLQTEEGFSAAYEAYSVGGSRYINMRGESGTLLCRYPAGYLANHARTSSHEIPCAQA